MLGFLACENPKCSVKISRSFSQISEHNYCSRSCAVTVNNSKYIKNPGIAKICLYCGKAFKSREKYCSRKCKDLGETVSAEELTKQIKDFVYKNRRIPYKSELGNYNAVRNRFETWNKAIIAAGFKPNPVMFAKKYVANDGDKCDSLAEKIIDDWFFARRIKHKRSFPYPGNKKFTVDFKVGENWIEFFGLSGELKRYDELKKEKLKLAQGNKIKIIEIYPKDIFPTSKLSNIFKELKQFSS